MKKLYGEHKGGNGLKKGSKILRDYFDENEKEFYSPELVKNAERKFTKWGVEMIKEGKGYKLLNYYLDKF